MKNIPKIGDIIIFNNTGGHIYGKYMEIKTQYIISEIEEPDTWGDINAYTECGIYFRLSSSYMDAVGLYESYYKIISTTQSINYEIY